MKISVIIPTLNEAGHIAKVLEALAVDPEGDHEVLVVDGGSEDETQAIAEARGAQVIDVSSAGRAKQMNRGAEVSEGEVLFFLHGDTLVPSGALDLIAESMEDPDVVGGGFLRCFDCDSWWLEWTCRLADWRSENWKLFLGDQGIFVRRDVFTALGGYVESQSCCEDLHLSLKMRKEGEVVALRPPVVSSARRFEGLGPFLTTLRDWWWVMLYLLRK